MKSTKAVGQTVPLETVKSDLIFFLWRLACARGAPQAAPNISEKSKPRKIDEILEEIDKQVTDDGNATGEEALKFINGKNIRAEVRNKKVLSDAKLNTLLRGLQSQKTEPLISSGESFKITASAKNSFRDGAVINTSFTVTF